MPSVSEILLEQGRQAADARRSRGAMIGQSVAAIGQVPGQILEARDESRRREAALALQQQEAARRASADKDDRTRAEQALALQREKFDFDKGIHADEQDAKNHNIAVQEAIQIQKAPQPVIDDWVQNRLPRLLPTNLGPDDASAMYQQSQTPQGRKSIVDGLVATAPALKRNLVAFGSDQTVIDENAPAGTPPVQTGAPKITYGAPQPMMVGGRRVPVRPGSDGKLYDLKGQVVTEDVGADVPPDTAAQIETARHNRATEAGSAGDVTALTPAGLDVAALMYRTTGTMPALGMGDKTTRQKIINRAAELTPADVERIGAGTNIASNKANFAADSAALNAMTKQRAAITAFEQTAQKNIDLFLAQAGKVVDTGSPLANRVARTVSGSMLGSPDQAAYDAARQVAINEIAKITSNPTLAGQLSDTARKEVGAFNPEGATLKQTVAVLRLLKQDMSNRTKSLDDEIATIQGRLRGGASPAAGAKADPMGLRR